MNILLVGFNLDGAMGDNFRYIVNNMKKYKKHNIFVIKKNDNKNKLKDESTLELEYKKNVVSILKDLRKIKKFINENKIDRIIILTPNLIYNSYISLFFNNIIKVYYLHDPIPHTGETFFRKLSLNIQNYISCKMSKKIIVASEHIKKEIIDKKVLRIKDEKVEVIYLGVLENLIFEDIKKDNINKTIDVIFFGRIEDYKGLDILIEAIKLLKDQNILLKCKIIGKGDLSKYITENEKNLFDITNEYIEDLDLAKEIAKSKIAVFPYKNATGTQTIQLSYYYNAVVIASNVGCFNDYIIDGKTGYLFEKGDSRQLSNIIKSLIKEQSDIQRISTSAESFLDEKFKTKDIINQYYKIIE